MTIYEKNKFDKYERQIKYELIEVDALQTKGERATKENSIEVRILCKMIFHDGRETDAMLRKDLFNNDISPDEFFSIDNFVNLFVKFRKTCKGFLSLTFYNEMIRFYNSLSDENKLLLEVYE